MYLGGFYIEPQAALAYDLAAIRFRGRDAATTNLPLALFKQELDNLDETSTTEVVMHLRTQSKTMNKVNPGKGVTMQPWELALSDAINGHKVGLGVHGSEGEAARAYDREMIKRHGLQAVEMINFQLADYIDMLGKLGMYISCVFLILFLSYFFGIDVNIFGCSLLFSLQMDLQPLLLSNRDSFLPITVLSISLMMP